MLLKIFNLILLLKIIIIVISYSISDPLPEYPPEIDNSKKSKFTLHHSDGTTIPSHPKV